jgi:ceramide glucosyltransferase
MQWEAVAINADFWSQVLQSRSLKPLDFALGAVMATRKECLEKIGVFRALADCLADDYQLGNRISRNGYAIELCPVVVECWDAPHGWRAVWKHQLRWARTIRVCQPVPYFFSILSNAGLWALVWLLVALPGFSVDYSEFPNVFVVVLGVGIGPIAMAAACVLSRILLAAELQRRLTRSRASPAFLWIVVVKDILQAFIWFLAFIGNRVEWRGERYRLARDGTLTRLKPKRQ